MLMANELPEDLVTQILLCLPVVSLLRFKSVCKSWYALITNQNFITKHLLHNKNSNTQHLLLTTRDKTIVSTISQETLQISHTPLPPRYLGIDKKIPVFVVGSCNGLVCLHDFHEFSVDENFFYEFHDVIWNPATKETNVIPKSNLRSIITPAHYHNRIQAMGFGFDAKTNDYKIIRILAISDYEGVIQRSEVYSLNSDSWREVVDGPSYKGLIDMGKCSNGMASWLVDGVGLQILEQYYDYECLEKFVLSFDMSDEVFLETAIPDNVRSDSFLTLFVLNESIGMVESINVGVDEKYFEVTFHIWSLLKVGIKDSWTRLFTIGPFIEFNDSLGFPLPLGFWKNDTMFIVKSDGELVLYDPFTKQMTKLQVHGDRESLQLVTYMETLVSVKGGNEFKEQDNC
jgi:F-box interacting protein